MTVAAAAASSAAAGDVLHGYLTHHGTPKGAAAAIVLVLIAGATVVLNWILTEHVFDHRRVRRALLGRHYLEGNWTDAVRMPDGTVQLGMTHIEASGSQLTFSGTNHDANGRHIGDFQTTALSVDGYDLWYICTTTTPDDDQQQRHDAGHLRFGRETAVPGRYTGHFVDLDTGSLGRYVGVRVPKEDEPNLAAEETRRETLLRLTRPLLSSLPPAGGEPRRRERST